MIFFIFIFIILIYSLFYILNKNLKINERFDNNYILPKVIYGYWDNLEGNDIIQAHLNTWKRNISKEWEINIITKNNVKDYVDDIFYNKYKNLNPVRFSDFLRVYLLSKNGGVWIDAGTIILNSTFLDKYYIEMIENKYDTTIYEFKSHSLPNQPYLENWFIMSCKNSKFITDLYNEFTISYNMDFLKYKINVLLPVIDLSNTLKTNTKSTYHMQHAIIHYLIYKGNKYKLNIKDAEESMFYIQKINEWNSDKVINYIINNQDFSNIYAIKLVNFNRKAINNTNKKDFIEKLNNIGENS